MNQINCRGDFFKARGTQAFVCCTWRGAGCLLTALCPVYQGKEGAAGCAVGRGDNNVICGMKDAKAPAVTLPGSGAGSKPGSPHGVPLAVEKRLEEGSGLAFSWS